MQSHEYARLRGPISAVLKQYPLRQTPPARSQPSFVARFAILLIFPIDSNDL